LPPDASGPLFLTIDTLLSIYVPHIAHQKPPSM
jgi:hypothetical protein